MHQLRNRLTRRYQDGGTRNPPRSVIKLRHVATFCVRAATGRELGIV